MINVVVVEDNDTIREGLIILIDGTEGYNCLAAYPKCETMIKNVNRLNPDVLLIDLMLPGISGIEGIKQVKAILPSIAIIVLTVYEENDHIFDALCAGASGYIVKKAPPAKLLNAIQDAYNGCIPMSSHIARKVIDLFQQKKVSNNEVNDFKLKLTEREKEILNKLVEGNSFKAIADLLSVSLETLRSDFRDIYKKIHIYSGSESIVRKN
jgi:DNA-binding NarL/FixJ family response regulator